MMFVMCSWEFEGHHWWAKAPDIVDFLRHPHRHLFKCQAWVEVTDNDREIEFILLKRFMQENSPYASGENIGSCELLAEIFTALLVKRYPDREVRVLVTEDGENGALVEHSKESPHCITPT